MKRNKNKNKVGKEDEKEDKRMLVEQNCLWYKTTIGFVLIFRILDRRRYSRRSQCLVACAAG